MTLRRIAACCLLVLCAAPAAGSAAAPQPAPTRSARPKTWSPVASDTSRYLPDTTVLATVNDKVIRVHDLVWAYYAAMPNARPDADSAGRVEFLNTMINKEVLARVAREAHRPETFEDRSVMREHTERVLANVLLQRTVLDSVHIEEADVQHAAMQEGYELRLRRLFFRDRAQAQRIRDGLAAGRLTWGVAVAAQGLPPEASHRDGELGWVKRQALDPTVATAVYDVKPGGTSPVLFESVGYTIYQTLERRERGKYSYSALRNLLFNQMRNVQIQQRSEKVMEVLRQRAGLNYDTANIVWAARGFPEVLTGGEGASLALALDPRVPEFDPADQQRVLARSKGGEFTLGQFVTWYANQSPYTRTSATSFQALRHQVDIAVLEPAMADLARERGLERDSLAVSLIGQRLEQMQVEHLNEDSILAHVHIYAKERRAYYEKNRQGFMTYPRVRYAQFRAASRAQGDSLAARLRGGAAAETILREDSLAGRTRGSIAWRSHGRHQPDRQQLDLRRERQ